MAEWDGAERRTDETRVRLAILEHCHKENKDSLIAIHKRISEIQTGVEQEIKQGLAAIFAKIDVQQTECSRHSIRTARLENNHKWMYGWLAVTWTTIVAGIGVALKHHGK